MSMSHMQPKDYKVRSSMRKDPQKEANQNEAKIHFFTTTIE